MHDQRAGRAITATAALALATALVACSGGSGKKQASPSTRPAASTTTPATAHAADTLPPGSTLAPGAVPDPCKAITQEQVSEAAGFTVEGEGVTADNGVGLLSCTYKAPFDDETNPGSQITIGTEPATDSVEEIRATLAAMVPDAKPVRADVGDGGWSITGDGYSELRVRIGAAQLSVSIVSPSDKAIDLAAADRAIATLVITHFGMERPAPAPTTTTSTLAPIVPIPGATP